MISKLQFQQLIQDLENRKMIPYHMDIAQVGNIHMVNLYNHLDSKVISSSVTTGMDQSLEVATLKALSEFVERSAFQEGFLNNNPYCQTERSDGFAAFPKLETDYLVRTKDNSLNEAIERYVWATWWDNTSISYDIATVSMNDKSFWNDSISLLQEVNGLLGIKTIKIIKPHFDKFPDKEVLIVACELLDGGVITGGACGNKSDQQKTLLRAVSELSRHALALHRTEVDELSPESFYEKRLCYFASEDGFELYQERLAQMGNEIVQLPNLKFDAEIKHEFLDLFYVHRCLFENQPPFIGGKLERLCL